MIRPKKAAPESTVRRVTNTRLTRCSEGDRDRINDPGRDSFERQFRL
jgi:hypothetical protein